MKFPSIPTAKFPFIPTIGGGGGKKKKTKKKQSKSGSPKMGEDNEESTDIFKNKQAKPIIKKIEQEKKKVVASIVQLDEVKQKDEACDIVKADFLKMQLDMLRTNDKCMSVELRKKVYEPWEKACKELTEELKLVEYNGDVLDWNKLSVDEVRKLAKLLSL